MIEVTRFKKEHLIGFELQEAQGVFSDLVDDDDSVTIMEASESSKTLIIDGYVTFIFGIVPVAEGRAQMWGLQASFKSAPESTKHKKVHWFRAVKKEIDRSEYKRIEAFTHDGFDEGHRALSMLGFKCETPLGMRNYYGEEDGYLYARIK